MQGAINKRAYLLTFLGVRKKSNCGLALFSDWVLAASQKEKTKMNNTSKF